MVDGPKRQIVRTNGGMFASVTGTLRESGSRRKGYSFVAHVANIIYDAILADVTQENHVIHGGILLHDRSTRYLDQPPKRNKVTPRSPASAAGVVRVG